MYKNSHNSVLLPAIAVEFFVRSNFVRALLRCCPMRLWWWLRDAERPNVGERRGCTNLRYSAINMSSLGAYDNNNNKYICKRNGKICNNNNKLHELKLKVENVYVCVYLQRHIGRWGAVRQPVAFEVLFHVI